MKIPKRIAKSDTGEVGVKLKLAGADRELSVAMSFDLYEKLDDAELRSYLKGVAVRSGVREPVIERYRPYQRLDASA